jgi:outer membrane protein insertion porin family
MSRIRIIFFSILSFCALASSAQDSTKTYFNYNYNNPKQYVLAGIDLIGTDYYDKPALIIISGLQVNQKIRIPSEDISAAITKLWKQKLFDDVSLRVTKVDEDNIWLQFVVKEKPRLSNFTIKGLKKAKAEDLREAMSIRSGQIITENMLNATHREIVKFFTEKGYVDARIDFQQIPDDVKKNTAKLKITVNRGEKVKIGKIEFTGNKALAEKNLRKLMKDTKVKRWFVKSKYMEDTYQDDKQKILDKYLSLGYRDAQIVSDSIWRDENKNFAIKINLFEGEKYFFRKIDFIGNTKYSTTDLNKVLRIKRGDVYDQSILDQRMNGSQDGNDITTIYMDDGYLFFRAEPIEVLVENDSIDLEIRISEGQQARINKVTVKGNSKTSDHVVLRELRTKPGQLFSKTDITRSLRELSQIGYFNPEALNVNPVPNPVTGTVDIEFKVEERANDQIELSGGWGAGFVVGTLGLSLNNFSARKVAKAKYWNPIPSGDGQRMSLRAQTNGSFFQSYSASFTEPWLGGKKPNALTLSVYHSIQTNGRTGQYRSGLYTTGASAGIGKRLRWPDDFFTIQYALSYQFYNNETDAAGNVFYSSIPVGGSNNFSFKVVLGRNSTDQPIYPRQGSNISLSLQFTPPYSLLDGRDYSKLDALDKTKWLEFYKWKFDATWFNRIVGNLVLMTRANFGFIGSYNSAKGVTPFERFWVGGSGLTGFNLDGRELIALRGYQDNSLTPYTVSETTGTYTQTGATIYNRYTMELRYPVSLNPQATVFPLIFAEAGGAWMNGRNFNPFDVNRSYGAGVRIFLPMFGMIGLDYGWGIDSAPYHPFPDRINGGNFHFLLGQQF